MGRQDIDFNDIARQISALPNLVKPGDMSRIMGCLDGVRDLPFPPGYLDELRSEMFKALQRGHRVMTYVYLAFYGINDKASHLKIGIAKNVKNRLDTIKTGNPLPNLWTFTAQFTSRQEAEAVESALLRHMAGDKAHGEWVNVHGISECAAREVVASLAEVATEKHSLEVKFAGFHRGARQ